MYEIVLNLSYNLIMKKVYRIISIETADIYKYEQEYGVDVGYKLPEVKSDAYFWLFKNCGSTVRLSWNTTHKGKERVQVSYRHFYNCGAYSRAGKYACTSH